MANRPAPKPALNRAAAQAAALTKAANAGKHPLSPAPPEHAAERGGAAEGEEVLVMFSARIPRQLKREVKRAALEEERSVQELLTDALRRYLDTR